MKTDFSKFEKKTGIVFKNKDLLREAFTHRSYLNEHRSKGLSHNERLEFLGDAVLELVATCFLFDKYPKHNEGELTSFRAALVNGDTLSQAANEIHIDDFLLLSRGEGKDRKGKGRQYILANAFEAIIGAIYLDQGYDKAREFITDTLLHKTDEIVEKGLWRDAKSFFQEKAQAAESITPRYEVLKEAGPDHSKVFTVGVFIGEELVAKDTGSSKQEAEQKAATKALKIKGWAE